MSTYRGLGIQFGLGVNGYFHSLYDVELIKAGIIQILRTKLGTRVHLPEFGSRLPELLFEPNDALLRGLASVYIKEAIERWEDRVIFNGVDILQEDETFSFIVHIAYKFNRQPDQVEVRLARVA